MGMCDYLVEFDKIITRIEMGIEMGMCDYLAE